MEVTKNNFKQLLPDIEDAIKKSCFICIDGEFTGLRVGRDVNSFDTPEEYYTTLSSGCNNFMLIQFGICTFRWDSDLKKFKHCAFNFYLFPRPYDKYAPDRVFSSQASSIEFLAAQGFDFNKLFCHGIPYLSTFQKGKLEDLLKERQKAAIKNSQNTSIQKDNIEVPPENKEFIENICKTVSDFLETGKEESFEINKCNAFQRKLIYQEIGELFADKVIIETKILPNKDRVLVITKSLGVIDKNQKLAEQFEKQLAELEDAVGFTKVVQYISESGKLVIGHNMLLDLLHTLNHFFAPLPESYSEFKEFASCMFPKILDTKFMSSSPPFGDKINCSALAPLLVTLSEEQFGIPDTEPEVGENLIGYCQTNEKNHEAGYDAFITGLCFLAMYKYVLKLRGGEIHESPFRSNSNLIKLYLNKLYLFKTAYYESPYINLSGKDAKPSREHVFHLTFPKDWLRSDISQLFSHFGNVHVAFIDDTSAYVGLTKRDQAHKVMKNLPSSHQYKVTPYKFYKKKSPMLTYDQLHWKSKNNSLLSTSSTPDRKRKLDVKSAATNSDESEVADTPNNSDDGTTPSAPKRTPDEKLLKPSTERASSEKSIDKQQHPESTARSGRKLRTNSGTFTVEDQVQLSKKDQTPVAACSPNLPNPRKDSNDVPWKIVQEKFTENLPAETKKWRDIANAFKESDNWD